LLNELHRLKPYDPDHLPLELELIETFRRRHPKLPQVACFDTAFHRTMPLVARMLPIPRRFYAKGVQRYGFHGLSYAYLMEELARLGDRAGKAGRVILAHLGNGASLAAVRHGKSIDTSMGFTPTAGLVMGTRCGDLDPGVAPYLAHTEKLSTKQFYEMVSHKSGLLGVSETSSDMRDLLVREAGDTRAADAVALFCYQAKKWIGSFAAALGGLDTLVFAGGIGENGPVIRERICAGLGFLGIKLKAAWNAKNADVISAPGGRVAVRVIRTDEERMIARSVCRILLTLMLSAACVLTGCQSPPPADPTPASTAALETRNNCYSLLHQLLDEERHASLLRFIKREHSDAKDLIKRISAASAAGAKMLEEFAKSDRSIPLNDIQLPPGEVKTRKAISSTKEKALLHQIGDQLELSLLLTQMEAMSYAWHLAEVAGENEVQPERAHALAGLSREMQDFYQESFVLLLSKTKSSGAP
jgi:acetate kinase